LPAIVEAMKDLKKQFEPVTYQGAGHGFMRAGEAPEPVAPVAKGNPDADKQQIGDFEKTMNTYKANKKAREDAWLRWKTILAKI